MTAELARPVAILRLVEGRSDSDELADMLFELRVPGLDTRRATARITRAIVEWAVAKGWSPRTEARVDVPDVRANAQLGFMDVLVRRGDGLPDLAIEIDSADKPWSVIKLQHAAAAGMSAIWVRWGDEDWAGVYDEVDVIQLPLNKHPRRRQSGAQVPVWVK